jgi:3-hydroxybutyryl-CoA dehydratase
MEPKDLTFEDIAVGASDSFERTWTEKDIDGFAAISGNTNPLHTDDIYAQSVNFTSKLIYGMHIAVVCSAFVGMYLPGKRCLCLRQSLDFKKPVYVGDTTTIRGVVKNKIISTRMLDIDITVTHGDDEVVTGTMLIKVLD